MPEDKANQMFEPIRFTGFEAERLDQEALDAVYNGNGSIVIDINEPPTNSRSELNRRFGLVYDRLASLGYGLVLRVVRTDEDHDLGTDVSRTSGLEVVRK